MFNPHTDKNVKTKHKFTVKKKKKGGTISGLGAVTSWSPVVTVRLSENQ